VTEVLERLTWFRQSAFRWQEEGLVLYIDPWGVTGDLPADVILITHAHFDHFQPDEIARLRTEHTRILAPADVAKELPGDVTPVAPGETHDIGGLMVQTVPAYNIVEERLDKHPKANGWVGYVIQLDGRGYYHAGDTDALTELESLRADVAMVPIGGTYTMDAGEAGGLVRAIGPKLAVPMHFGFVVGSPSDADRFCEAAAPVPVEVLTPTDPFEQP
jgi:L-ascorbate metabolism protein UlaG (beta-lactamase superfamily)